MIDLIGEFTNATIMTSDVETSALGQIQHMIDSPAFDGPVAIMPDVHAGKGSVVGFTMPLKDKVCPSSLGVDIGCGVLGYNLGHLDVVALERVGGRTFKSLDEWVRSRVPSGMNHRLQALDLEGYPAEELMASVEALSRRTGQDLDNVKRSLGTLGGGNHMIELDLDLDENVWLIIHTGSRNFGLRVCNWHQNIAKGNHPSLGDVAYLEGALARAYLDDVKIAQRYAALNRRLIADIILRYLIDRSPLEVIESVHNYIGEDGIIRKGAISARAGEKVIIPWNMAEGLIVGVGKGNPDWNFSAPHGAGRVMSRAKAKEAISMHAYEQRMKSAGVWSSCVEENTLDEAPQAYKDAASVEACIGDTVEVVNRMKPIYNFKASEDPIRSKKKKEKAFKRARANTEAVAGLTLDGVPDKYGYEDTTKYIV